MRSRGALRAAPVLLCLALAAGCARDRNVPDYGAAYRELASSSIGLYARIEPLRASRLGLVSADSLLFCYSREETDDAVTRLTDLETRLSKIPPGRLSASDIDRATVIIDWIRGTRFAFLELGCCRSNPLLYVWAVEEALWVIPSRIVPPYAGELEAYRRRISRIPALLASATANLENPAEWHVRSSIERLDTLETGLGRLDRLVERRYGSSLDGELGTARRAIRDFREYAAATLLPASHGRLIIGSEDLTKIFRYDEMIDSDPNMLAAEAEKQIKRITAEQETLARRAEFERESRRDSSRTPVSAATDEPFEERAARLLRQLDASTARGTPGGGPGGVETEIAYPAAPRYVSRSTAGPCLSIPPADEEAVVTAPPLAGSPCRVFIAFPERARRDGDDALRFALLPAVSRMLEPDRLRCAARDTVSAVFSSATFDDGWRYVNLQELMKTAKKDDPALYGLVLRDWRTQYARLIVVLALHAGTMTSDAAERYLIETLALEPHEAAREVLEVTVSPALAYPAVSMIIVDEMIKNVSYVFGYDNPQEELAKILLASRDVPLPMIVPRTRSN